MSHEVESMAYANEVPWHGLGANVDPNSTVEEMAAAAGLNWSLLPITPTIKLPSGAKMTLSDRRVWVRDKDESVITQSSAGWRPFQPAQTLGFMRNYVQAGSATLETAGSLRGGKIVWALARLGHDFEVRPGDKVRGYLLITSPNVVGQSITVRTTTVRVVCANTMAMAERAGGVHYRQNHMSDFDVEAAKEAVGESHEQLARAEQNAKIILGLKISTEDAIKKVLAPIFCREFAGIDGEIDEDKVDAAIKADALPRSLTNILASVESGPGQKEVKGTGWAVLNGVTHWADHASGNTNAGRMFRSWLGDRGRQKLAVEKALLELAQ